MLTHRETNMNDGVVLNIAPSTNSSPGKEAKSY
jgi:hypothetical protein